MLFVSIIFIFYYQILLPNFNYYQYFITKYIKYYLLNSYFKFGNIYIIQKLERNLDIIKIKKSI